MSTLIDDVKSELINDEHKQFFHDSGTNYLRLLDTPHIWGMEFGKGIMTQAVQRQQEFERAIVEMVQKSRYRCDVASLNCPDPDWGKAILGAMDLALSTEMKRTQKTQFRFLFGQTPLKPVGEPDNLIDFKAALVRLIRERSSHWEMMPEIWIGRFYEISAGLFDSLLHKLIPDSIISDDNTKMTWNHSKIIAVDGSESLVGGHNLNMDLFRSYPPVHDASVVVHGAASYGSQLYLNEMWTSGKGLLYKQSLNTSSLEWKEKDSYPKLPLDPLSQPDVQSYMENRRNDLFYMHETGIQPGPDPEPPYIPPLPSPHDIEAYDLRTLDDLEYEVIEERPVYNSYEKLSEYKKASRILCVGKYWTGLDYDNDFRDGSGLMKKTLIMSAKKSIHMSQMDLISAWKKNWSDHVVCHWLIDALLKNKRLTVQVVVSPLDAGAGAEGDQYSFGSGASRTFDLIEYYVKHEINDRPIPDPTGERQHALKRISVAPLYYTDKVPSDRQEEGKTYKWPNLSKAGRTYSLKAKPLSEDPPHNGIIGHPAKSVREAGGFGHPAVDSAPGNHAKIMIIDEELYVIGSDNLYPGNLSEFNYLVEGKEAVDQLLSSYWRPLWTYSAPHGMVSKASSFSLNQAAYVPDTKSYQYGYKSTPNLAITGAPKDTDWTRWAILYDGRDYRLFFMRTGRNNQLYPFAYNSQSGKYEYGFRSASVLTIDGMPDDADTSNFSMTHDGSVYRFYMKSASNPAKLYEAGYNYATYQYEYRHKSNTKIQIGKAPADTDWSRWGVTQSGSQFYFYAFKSGSNREFYQFFFDLSSGRYEYNFPDSTKVFTLKGMPSNSNSTSFDILHDEESYYFYHQKL
ncbi:phospholipase [Grimontia sp. NTOU-MAR1]|uniref:phospholipase n=1 Tax=Grimontia sp. NTOU-MAR1 TaxID=3111011 RepID=UPI002DB7BC7A|nr:phospholipase [Grimontia sp. NTOU-MAR1]WRV99752.1 phospholipase [Grimontia sp. NTOU-MAR1]